MEKETRRRPTLDAEPREWEAMFPQESARILQASPGFTMDELNAWCGTLPEGAYSEEIEKLVTKEDRGKFFEMIALKMVEEKKAKAKD
jgi:hypothetical protein